MSNIENKTILTPVTPSCNCANTASQPAAAKPQATVTAQSPTTNPQGSPKPARRGSRKV